MAQSVFHEGELEVQAKAGVRAMASRVGRIIDSSIPDGADDFLAERQLIVVSAQDEQGNVWVSPLTGTPGFIRVLDSRTVQIRTVPPAADPIRPALTVGSQIGTIAIEFATRQRIRLNGRVLSLSDDALVIHTEQVYGNCPKYIQIRTMEPDQSGASSADVATHTPILTATQQAWIARADTFFIGSLHPEGGADASHRGGNPGFVRVLNERTLEFPDYQGNMMFNTLGNIAANPHSGLLFLDFENGATLHLTGCAEIVWDEAQRTSFPGAERLVRFTVAEAVEIPNTLPLQFHFYQYSRFNPT